MPPQSLPPTDSKDYAPPPGSKFDFILNSGQKPKRKITSSLSKIPRSILIPVGALILLFILLSLPSLFSGKNKAVTNQLIGLAARQQEILRVSDVAEPLLQENDTHNLEATTTASITSDQIALTGYLGKNNVKLDGKTLAAYINKTIDSQLATAHQSNAADQAYMDYLAEKLADYRASLKSAYAEAGPNAQLIINDSYDSAGLILGDLVKQ